jgi:cytoskeleton protein RodZ
MNEIDPDKQPDSAEEAAPTEAAAPQVSPGEMLREAREARGLSQAELAEAAKLPQATIASLECDDFAVLNEPVYVRGYYRKCALTLETDVDAMVRAYEQKARPAAPALPDKIPVVAGGGVSIFRRLLRGVLILLLLGLLAAAGWWLLQPPTANSGNGGFGAFNGGDASGESFGDAGLAGGQETESEFEPQPEPDPSEAAEPSAAEASTAQDGARSSRADEVEVAATGEAAAPILELRFQDESWLRVRDANDRTLMNELVSAGARERIEGEAPLELFVGYAQGVEVTWRGEPIDLDDATRSNNTALVSLE